MQQLLYTSAPKLLEAGKTGFGTLARSKEMPQPLVAYLERISTFDRQAGVAAVLCYTTHRMGRVIFHVFSRVGDCGADYTGRTNHLAHHFVIEEGTSEAAALQQLYSPAGLMLNLLPLWRTSYTEGPGYVGDVAAPMQPQAAAGAWAQLTGKPRTAAWLATAPYNEGCCLALEGVGQEPLCLQLFDEALGGRSGRGWGAAFATALVSNLSLSAVPFVCLDARQKATGVTPPRGCPVLELNSRLAEPPVTVAPAAPPVATPPPAAPYMPAAPGPPPMAPPAYTPAAPPARPAAQPVRPARRAASAPPPSQSSTNRLLIVGVIVAVAVVAYMLGSQQGETPTQESKPEVVSKPQPPAAEEQPPAGKKDKKHPAAPQKPAPEPKQQKPTVTTTKPVTQKPEVTTPEPVAQKLEVTTPEPVTQKPEETTPEPATQKPEVTAPVPVTQKPEETTPEPVTQKPEDTTPVPVTVTQKPEDTPPEPRSAGTLENVGDSRKFSFSDVTVKWAGAKPTVSASLKIKPEEVLPPEKSYLALYLRVKNEPEPKEWKRSQKFSHDWELPLNDEVSQAEENYTQCVEELKDAEANREKVLGRLEKRKAELEESRKKAMMDTAPLPGVVTEAISAVEMGILQDIMDELGVNDLSKLDIDSVKPVELVKHLPKHGPLRENYEGVTARVEQAREAKDKAQTKLEKVREYETEKLRRSYVKSARLILTVEKIEGAVVELNESYHPKQ